MGKKVEVEIKFPLLNVQELLTKLKEIAEHKGDKQEKDHYYVPVHRDFLKAEPINEWFRIRQTSKGTTLNYKKWHNTKEKRAVSCDELETGVEDIEVLKEMLQRLDFKEIILVDKLRRTWHYKDVIIGVDTVEGLGDFIELETEDVFDTVEEAKKRLYEVAEELGAALGEQNFKGYPHILLEKEGLVGEF